MEYREYWHRGCRDYFASVMRKLIRIVRRTILQKSRNVTSTLRSSIIIISMEKRKKEKTDERNVPALPRVFVTNGEFGR